MPLNTIEAIAQRYSCRAFSDRLPSEQNLNSIARAGIASPSAMNRQHWQVVVVRDPALVADLEAEGMKNLAAQPDQSMYERILSRGGKLYYNAPCMMLIATPKGEGGSLDCGIVTQSIALAATSLGIDNLICGLAGFSFAGERRDEFVARLGFPEGYALGIAVLLGYATAPGGKPHEPDLNKISWV